jgi:hypothetical protein
MKKASFLALVIVSCLGAQSAMATPFFFSTGNTDGKMAMASRPPGGSGIEIEAADDFVLTGAVSLNSATFVGLVPAGANVTGVAVAIYHVFPVDSDTVRVIHVVTRANSPSDTEFVSRETGDGSLTFTTTTLATGFTALNSVLNGIHPAPGQFTGGEGAVTGNEVQFSVAFTTPIQLPNGHYFFVPQVELDNGNFFWLSAPRPIVPPGTPFPPGATDLQAWMRNADLDPDWSRVGTDIIAAGTFNATFSLSGENLNLFLSPAHLFVGLKNSDDQGTEFDLKVEVLKNGVTIANGLERCITGVTRNPLKATEAVVPFEPFEDTAFTTGDTLSLRVSTRIGTNPDDTKCLGPGGSHNNAVGLRLYYDSASRPSRFDAEVSPNLETDLFLHSNGNPCANAPSTGVSDRFLDASAPVAAKEKCKDSAGINFKGGNPFSEIGTWSLIVP